MSPPIPHHREAKPGEKHGTQISTGEPRLVKVLSSYGKPEGSITMAEAEDRLARGLAVVASRRKTIRTIRLVPEKPPASRANGVVFRQRMDAGQLIWAYQGVTGSDSRFV